MSKISPEYIISSLLCKSVGISERRYFDEPKSTFTQVLKNIVGANK